MSHLPRGETCGLSNILFMRGTPGFPLRKILPHRGAPTRSGGTAGPASWGAVYCAIKAVAPSSASDPAPRGSYCARSRCRQNQLNHWTAGDMTMDKRYLEPTQESGRAFFTRGI